MRRRPRPNRRPSRRRYGASAGLAAMAAVWLGATVAGHDRYSRLDVVVARAELAPGSLAPLVPVAVDTLSVGRLAAFAAAVTVGGLLAGRGPAVAAATGATGPAAGLAAHHILKPAFGRTFSVRGGLWYPSGHAAAATAAAFGAAFGLTRPATRGRRAALVAAATVALVEGWALVAGGYHAATDVVGGWGVGYAFAAAAAGVTDPCLRGGRRDR